MSDPEFKTFAVTGFETRAIPVEYLVEAETAEEALDKALEGSTVGERDTGIGEVQDRVFESADVSEIAEVPVSEEDRADFNERLQAAVGIVTSGVELLDRVDSAIPLDSRPGTARITTPDGTFLVTIRLENFSAKE